MISGVCSRHESTRNLAGLRVSFRYIRPLATGICGIYVMYTKTAFRAKIAN